MDQKLDEFGLKLSGTIYVVTDNEPKMLAAFRDQCRRVGCSDHYLNKQLHHAFESEQIHVNRNQIEKVDCEIVQNLFHQVKKIVSSVRRCHRQQNLTRRLQTYSETRFNGAFIMMAIFREVFFELPSILINSPLMNNYNSIDKEILDCICEFLDPFQEVIEALSEDQEPTLHRVLPLRQCLINKCNVTENDIPAVIQLKIFLGKMIVEVNISPYLFGSTCFVNKMYCLS